MTIHGLLIQAHVIAVIGLELLQHVASHTKTSEYFRDLAALIQVIVAAISVLDTLVPLFKDVKNVQLSRKSQALVNNSKKVYMDNLFEYIREWKKKRLPSMFAEERWFYPWKTTIQDANELQVIRVCC